MSPAEVLLYQTEDGLNRIEIRFEGDTLWLTQNQMADLFQTSKQNVSLHLKHIFQEGELSQDAVVKDYLTTASDGKKYRTSSYALEAVLAVGYRVKSLRGTQFRTWATQTLREYLVKGFAMDDDRPNMGLTSWTGDRPKKSDAGIAKNYLGQEELDALNRIVSAYLEFAELQALNRKPMHMADWISKLDDFLKLSDREILTHAGRISHASAIAKAEAEYDEFHSKSLENLSRVEKDFQMALDKSKRLELTRPKKKPRGKTE